MAALAVALTASVSLPARSFPVREAVEGMVAARQVARGQAGGAGARGAGPVCPGCLEVELGDPLLDPVGWRPDLAPLRALLRQIPARAEGFRCPATVPRLVASEGKRFRCGNEEGMGRYAWVEVDYRPFDDSQEAVEVRTESWDGTRASALVIDGLVAEYRLQRPGAGRAETYVPAAPPRVVRGRVEACEWGDVNVYCTLVQADGGRIRVPTGEDLLPAGVHVEVVLRAQWLFLKDYDAWYRDERVEASRRLAGPPRKKRRRRSAPTEAKGKRGRAEERVRPQGGHEGGMRDE
ncbi:MAG: hypothetical protein D6729_06170 [Deltaproteobacteria bacterium]|nr:MAG: hypothetical protein D6729_06170 [Deltaproteobacteria bacterium]